MVAYLSVVIAGILGFLAGVLVGLFIVSGGDVTLALAAVAVVATLCSPFLAKPIEEAADRRREELQVRRENRERYERHALDLNAQVFAPMVEVFLQSPLANPPLQGNMDRPGGSGLHVRLPNAQPCPVEDLANWQLAEAHLNANPTLREGWDDAVDKTGRYYELRESAFDATVAKLTQLVESGYGPQMRITTGVSDSPSWFNVASVAWFILGRRGPLTRRDFYNPGVSPGAPPDLPRTVSMGGGYFLQARDAVEGDPARFQRVFDAVWADPELGPAARAVAAAESTASAAISELSERARVYSNTILISHTFEGDCGVCRNWVPR